MISTVVVGMVVRLVDVDGWTVVDAFGLGLAVVAEIIADVCVGDVVSGSLEANVVLK